MTGARYQFPAEPVTDPAEALDARLADLDVYLENLEAGLRIARLILNELRAELHR
jgi:hypothetical protein